MTALIYDAFNFGDLTCQPIVCTEMVLAFHSQMPT
jgi:hypothetical protein